MKTQITLNNSKISLNRTNIKYVSNFTNFDKKYVFAREFVNGTYFTVVNKRAVVEVGFKDGSDKEILLIDIAANKIEQISMDDLKKLKKDLKENMLFEYFSDLS